MHLAIDLYIKLLKQVQTHLNTAYTFHKYFKLKLCTDRNSRLSCLHLILITAVLKNFLFLPP